MAASSKRTVNLPSEQARYIDRLVASGRYASASDVVRAGLTALSEQDEAVERWLRDEVVPVYDAMRADPSRAIPAEQVFSELRRHSDSIRGA
ncbi:MAG TPA: type II toxin-antitoxin system ParD family antitoxin [Stellaceae bacterium]